MDRHGLVESSPDLAGIWAIPPPPPRRKGVRFSMPSPTNWSASSMHFPIGQLCKKLAPKTSNSDSPLQSETQNSVFYPALKAAARVMAGKPSTMSQPRSSRLKLRGGPGRSQNAIAREKYGIMR